MRIFRWLAPILIVLIAFAVLFPISPLYRPQPSDDPSVYLYVGQRMLEGGVPYRDAWDHKQPLAFFLFALGLAATPGSLWGVWWIELALAAAAGLLALRAAEHFAPRWLAALAACVGLLTLGVIAWGYSLEELSLPLQMGILLALARFLTAERERERNLAALAAGILTGLCFFLKQSLIGAGLAVGLYLGLRMLLNREWRLLRALAAMAAGFALVTAAVLGYLFANHAWAAYRDAAVAFNLAYANLGLLERANAALSALVDLSSTPGLFLAFGLWLAVAAAWLLQCGPRLAGWINARAFPGWMSGAGAALALLGLGGELVGGQPGLGLLQVLLLAAGLGLLCLGLLAKNARLRARLAGWLQSAPLFPAAPGDLRGPFLAVGALIFPITLALLSLSGRNYAYYFITLTPSLMLLFALAGSLLMISRRPGAQVQPAALILTALALALAYHPTLLAVTRLRQPANPPAPEIAAAVQENTTPQDTILVWGKDTTFVYFAAGRRAPSRHFYQAAIFLDSYNQAFGAAGELYRDLLAAPPALFVIPGDPAETGACPLPAGSDPNSAGQIFAFICQRYHYAGQAGEFQLYRLNQ